MRKEWIDALKGMAMLMVIAVHISQVLPRLPQPIAFACSFGAMGVQLFFLLCAYCACISYKKTRRGGGYLSYLSHRFKAMLPFYLLGICVYAGLKLVFPFVSPLQRLNYNIVTILPNALLLNDLCPWAQNNVVPGGWSISCMMIFAVGFPAFIWFLKEGALVKSIGLTILGVLVSVLLFIGFDLSKEYCLLFFTTQLAPFLVGILLHQYKAEVTQLSRKPILCCVAFFGLVLLTALCVKVDCYAFLYRQVLMAIAFGALVCAAQAVAKYPKSLLFVGRHSYSIYLFHFALIWMISR